MATVTMSQTAKRSNSDGPGREALKRHGLFGKRDAFAVLTATAYLREGRPVAVVGIWVAPATRTPTP